ncbi:MAG: indolepyruvate oxidoreductase subunit beta [bacterium]|nr:indolepyruvate oxidoreductase subunit beta [bacterium]
MAVTNVLIVGVGGQGVLLASKLISVAALSMDMDVKQSEVHGMSQRGGSVSSHVRFGDKVHSALIEDGTVDVLLSFELLESLRYAHMLKKDGTIVVNDQRIDPVPVAIGDAEYPADIEGKLKKYVGKVVKLDGLKLAQEAGFAGAVNVVLLGALSKISDAIPEEVWLETIKSTVKEKFVDINLKAFELGRGAVE